MNQVAETETRLVDTDFEKPECQLVGTDGNVFALIGTASRALKRAGLRDHAEEMRKRIMEGEARSYDEAIQIIMEYVDAY